MPNTPDFVAHVMELMRPARATAKAMFGGHGVYIDEVFVAILVDDVLYLKCDADRAAAFDALDLSPFVYMSKDGRRLVTKYRRAPDEALENSSEMRRWLSLALAAALAQPKRAAGLSKSPVKRRSR
jgi:DNA transformation protein and related proteins